MSISLLSSPLSAEPTKFSFARRTFLPLRSDALWQIETGIVRTTTMLEDAKSVILGLWGAGDVVGRILSTAEPYKIECLTQVEATLVPASRWHEITDAILSHTQRSGELIEILHCRQTEFSLLRLFAWLSKRFGQEVEQGQRIELRLTHQDIADLIGSTRVTVTRLLNDLEQQGIIQRQGHQFIVLHDQSPFWYYEI